MLFVRGSHWHERDSNPHSPRFKLGRYSRSRTVPRLFGFPNKESPVGFELTISTLAGSRALRCSTRTCHSFEI